MTDEQKLRFARALVEQVLAGPTGRLPIAGRELEGVRQVLGTLAGDYRSDDPFPQTAEDWESAYASNRAIWSEVAR